MKLGYIYCAFIIFILSSILSAEQNSDLFWMNEFEDGIANRNLFLNSCGLNNTGLEINSWGKEKREQTLSILNQTETHNTWNKFITGIILFFNQSPNAQNALREAVVSASDDPGTTWVLFIEFNRYKLFDWADSCLHQLEKQLLSSGASSSILVSTQIKNLAFSYQKEDKADVALNLYRWAEQFDPNETWTIKKRFWMSFPGDFDQMRNALNSYLSVISKSWHAQLAGLETIYSWLRVIFIIFMIAVFIVITLKYFPYAVHFISDLYPLSVSISLRPVLASIIVFSSAFFSIFLLFWIIAFLTWRFINKGDKRLFSVALCILIFAPIDSFILNIFENARDPDNTVSLYKKVSAEGYTEKTDTKLIAQSIEHRSNALHSLAAAISSYKKGDLQPAQSFIENSLRILPNDPVALVMAGNIFFQKDQFNKSKSYYEKAIATGSKDISAKFNLAQCYLRQSEVVKGTELMDQAAREDKSVVNNFINKNDFIYSKNWPALRSVMMPEYSSLYFWKNMLFKYYGNTESTDRHWGISFFGINSMTSFFLFCIFFFILLSSSIFNNSKKVRKYFECKLCGRIMCKSCSQGILCNSCDSSLEFVKNEKKADQIRFSIVKIFTLIRFVKVISTDIIFPGLGAYLKDEKKLIPVIMLISTSFIYSSYFCIFKYVEKFGFNKGTLIFLAVLISYNIYFIVIKYLELSKFLESDSKA